MATQGAVAIIVDKDIRERFDIYLYVRIRNKPTFKSLRDYMNNLQMVLDGVPAPPGFIREGPTVKYMEDWIRECEGGMKDAPVYLNRQRCAMVTSGGVATPWPLAIGLRVREAGVMHFVDRTAYPIDPDLRALCVWRNLYCTNLTVAHEPLRRAFNEAAAEGMACAIVTGDRDTIMMAAASLAPDDAAAAAAQLARARRQ